jgi:hypothetical protein
MPKQTHPNPRRMRTRLPPSRMTVNATPAGSPDIYPMLAQTNPKLKPTLRARFIKTKASWRFGKAPWMDGVCPTCMCEISFDHRCDPHDIAIAKHADSVRDTLRTTPLLDTIISAHAFERTGTEKPAPISMGPSFFHDAAG